MMLIIKMLPDGTDMTKADNRFKDSITVINSQYSKTVSEDYESRFIAPVLHIRESIWSVSSFPSFLMDSTPINVAMLSATIIAHTVNSVYLTRIERIGNNLTFTASAALCGNILPPWGQSEYT